MSESGAGDRPSEVSSRRGHDVFISYSREDKETADAVCAALEGAGIPCWIGPRDTQAGAYGRSIMEAIRSARMLVLILSAHADRTPNVLTEVAEAFDRKLPLLPFRLANFAATDEMRFYIRTQHWIDAFPGPAEQYLPTLIARVRKRLRQAERAEPTSGEAAAEEIQDAPPPKQHVEPPPNKRQARREARVDKKVERPAPRRRRRWVYAALAVLLLGGATVAVVSNPWFWAKLIGMEPTSPGAMRSAPPPAGREARLDAPRPETDDTPSCRAGDCWGAVGIGDALVITWAVDLTSREAAEAAAQKRCAGRCYRILTFHNTCGAYAVGTERPVYGWGIGNDRDAAERNAIAQCRTKGPGCVSRVSACTTR